MTIYRLIFDCDNDLVLRTPLDYFNTHFIGSPMWKDWAPPPIRIDGKNKRIRDFVSWMLSAPVVSEKCKEALEPSISPYVEFLPLINLRKNTYFAVNVIFLAEALDLDNSDILYAPDDPNVILSVHKYVLHKDKIPHAPIFKVKEWPSEVLVTQDFIDLVEKHGLEGAEFVDSSKDLFDALF